MRDRLLVALLALVVSPAFAKSLYWRALDVQANLDRDGALHVIERQSIVFDGDWNGGERTFRVGTGQSLQFESISRVDESGEHRLLPGELEKVDHFAFTGDNVLRWRSRLPDDPPFSKKEITYVIRYAITGVLRLTDGIYSLNHDFAFPQREGVIQNFSLRFDLDPAWKGAKSPVVVSRRNLVPGESVVVPLRLEFAGAGRPAAVRTLSQKTVYGVLLLFAIAIAYFLFDFFTHEQAKGRWAPIDASLDESLFSMKPELAGAALDNKTGAPEVAAVLARLTQEGKLSSRIETRGMLFKRQVLCLTLNVDERAGYEAKLLRALFFGAKNTDTDRIRKHYKGRGFDPAKIIEGGIEQDLQQIKGWMKQPVKANWKAGWIALAATLVLLIVAGIAGGEYDPGTVIFVGFIGVIGAIAASIAANLNASAVTDFLPRFAIPAVFLAPLYWLTIHYTRSAVHLVFGILTPIAICAWTAVITRIVLDVLRTPEGPERIAFRKKLYAARKYFISELRSREPRLRDEWYPYLLAFGLGRHVDRWFGSYGSSAAVTTSGPRLPISSSGSSSPSAPAFTGGGGAFGGAGATGGWAIAAAAMGAGVSAPSSSSGGGGGSSSSSSSSSSGGGGGGGW